ncbi:MAG TPA: hypothetical protein VGW34_07350 [Allosphingosinicella sp.]|nr:hypothetical protein [Allosphingosinicella sp.]
MILEVLPAQQGDCLMLHSESEDGPGLILIDGGPAGVSSDSLIPRLEELRGERIDAGLIADDEPLVIDLLIVSHVDDDHINGVIDLLEGMLGRQQANEPPLFKVKELWHNSFDRILGNDETGTLLASTQFGAASMAAVIEEAEEGAPTDHAKVLASVKQGDDLKRLAAPDALDIPVNGQFGGALIQTVPGELVAREAAGIELVVLGPRRPELVELQEEFDKWLKRQPPAERTEASLLAALDDESAANLSSIVLLARKDDRTILLTGDARSDKVLEGLKDCGLCGDGETIEVGILKMPHHGSIRNLDDEGDFLGRVTSRNYIFSGNGEHGNPDRETFELLFKTRADAAMNLYLTYPLPDIDRERRKVYDKERSKKIKKGKDVPEWSDQEHGLAAILSPPPGGATVTEHDGSTMQIEPSEPS